MAFRKTKVPITPNKLKKSIFAKSWCRGASASWKLYYYDRLRFKKFGPYDEGLGKK